MVPSSDDPFEQMKRLEDISRGQTDLYIQASEKLISAEKEKVKHAVEAVLAIGRIICPEKLEQMQQANPVRPLSEHPLDEIVMAIINAANLLKLAAASTRTGGEAAAGRLAGELESAKNQVTMERHRANDLQARYERLLEEVKGLRKGPYKAKNASDEKSLTRLADRPVGTAFERLDLDGAEFNPTLAERAAIKQEAENLATAKWKAREASWSKEKKDRYNPIIIHIGRTGEVATSDLKKAMAQAHGVDDKTMDNRLTRLVQEEILDKRNFFPREKGKSGRIENAYPLTLVGQMAYRALTGSIARPPLDEFLLKKAQTPDHSELCLRVVRAFQRLGIKADLPEERIMLSENRWTDPDVVLPDYAGEKLYLEAETAEHITSKILWSKWRNNAEVGNNRIHLAMRKRSDVLNIGYGAVQAWASQDGYPWKIDLYLTSLDYLESLPPPARGQLVVPWVAVKTILPSTRVDPGPGA